MKEKKWLLIISLLVVMVGVAAFVQAKQVGMRIEEPMPPHHHDGPLSGGKIKLPSFSVRLSATQGSIAVGTWTKVNLDSVQFDTKGWFDYATNYRYTPLIAGNYVFAIRVLGSCATNNTRIGVAIYKNGTLATQGWSQNTYAGSQDVTAQAIDIIQVNGSTDYIETWVNINGTGTCHVSGLSNSNLTAMSGSMISY